MTLRDLSEKDVIQLKTGENLGRIDDLAFEDGQITQVVLHGRARMFGLLGRDDDLFIPWAAVKTIGTDVIMWMPKCRPRTQITSEKAGCKTTEKSS